MREFALLDWTNDNMYEDEHEHENFFSSILILEVMQIKQNRKYYD